MHKTFYYRFVEFVYYMLFQVMPDVILTQIHLHFIILFRSYLYIWKCVYLCRCREKYMDAFP